MLRISFLPTKTLVSWTVLGIVISFCSLTPKLLGQSTSVTLAPTSLTFPVQVVGTTSAALQVTLTNVGSTSLSLTSITVSTPQFSSPSNTCGTSVAAGASCTISVVFNPKISGFRSATLSVSDNATGSPQTVALSGQATVVSLSTKSLAFGSQTVGTTSAARSVTLTNVGTTTLSITSIAISGTNAANFAMATNTCGASVAASANCSFSITFSPAATGNSNARVAISDNGGASPQAVTLSGTGTAPVVSVVVHPATAPVTFATTVQFTATVTGSTNGVNWFVDGIAHGNTTVGTIDATGLYTPPAATGNHTIKATVVGLTASATASAVVTNYAGVFTAQNDNQRTGQNTAEITLAPSNVNKTAFGKVFSYAVDGQVHAQPLYAANVAIPGQGYHNVVYVATEHDSVYAFDADGKQTSPLWQASFLDPTAGVTTIPEADFAAICDYCSAQTEYGITATPVIDSTTNTLYVIARTKEVSGTTTNYVFHLHALDTTTGSEKFGGPVAIQASSPGSGVGGDGNGHVLWDGFWEMVRPALLLSNGTVYLASASLGDAEPFHGWVIGYDAQSLQQKGVFNATANGKAGGIWQNASGPSADSLGNIYAQTGNGTFDANTGGSDYGQTALKLTPSPVDGSLSLADWFTPHDQANLNKYDYDLASGGILILPDQPGSYPHLAIGGGKGGTIYVLNRDAMGKYNSAGDTQIPQAIVGAINASVSGMPFMGVWNAPSYWNGYVYIFGQRDFLKVFQISNGVLTTSPISTGNISMHAPVAVISANANTNGIVWVLQWEKNILRAYNANNVVTELYDSNQNATRDALDGVGVKNSPTVANGRVYVGTSTNLDVYGLLP